MFGSLFFLLCREMDIFCLNIKSGHLSSAKSGHFNSAPTDSKFISRVAPTALRDDKTIAEIAGEFQVNPNGLRFTCIHIVSHIWLS